MSFWAGRDVYRGPVVFDNGVVHQVSFAGSAGHYANTHSTFVTDISGHFSLVLLVQITILVDNSTNL